jgi:hypothetical protein
MSARTVKVLDKPTLPRIKEEVIPDELMIERYFPPTTPPTPIKRQNASTSLSLNKPKGGKTRSKKNKKRKTQRKRR